MAGGNPLLLRPRAYVLCFGPVGAFRFGLFDLVAAGRLGYLEAAAADRDSLFCARTSPSGDKVRTGQLEKLVLGPK